MVHSHEIYDKKNKTPPLIQFPSIDKDWLIAEPSFNLSPVAPVDSARSL